LLLLLLLLGYYYIYCHTNVTSGAAEKVYQERTQIAGGGFGLIVI